MLRRTCRFALSIAFLSMFLAACGGAPPLPPDRSVGFDAIAPDGRWGTIVEYDGEPPVCHLSLLNLGQEAGLSYSLGGSILCSGDSRRQSSFSPDSNYVLYRISDGWQITKTSIPPASPTLVATDEQDVQFLPNGRLLVISTTNGLKDFFDVDPETALLNKEPIVNKELILSRILFSFPTQFVLDSLKPPACAHRSLPESTAWVAIDVNYNAFVLVAVRGHPTQERPLEAPSLVNLVTETLALDRDPFEQEIKVSAGANQLSGEELEAQLNSKRAEFVSERLAGVPSPDGTKLLLLHLQKVEGGQNQYLSTLKLFNLEKGADPNPIELSVVKNWQPYFAFSPDGQQILYEGNFSSDGGRSLYLHNPDDKDNKGDRLVAQNISTPCWY